MNDFRISYGPMIDDRHCNGCGKCYNLCPMDIFSWDEGNQRPTVEHAGECWFCCFCEVMCPEVAIDVRFPLHHMVDFGIDLRSVRTVVEEFESKQK